jgi:hypothetical protein
MKSGGAAWAGLVVMPAEEAAIGYLKAIRSDEGFPTGYGDDQVYPASDLVIAQDGTVLLSVEPVVGDVPVASAR